MRRSTVDGEDRSIERWETMLQNNNRRENLGRKYVHEVVLFATANENEMLLLKVGGNGLSVACLGYLEVLAAGGM